MIKLLFLFTVFAFSFNIKAQDKVEVIQLDRNDELLNTVDLGEYGVIIKTGKNYMNSKKLGWKLRYYSTTLDLIWEIPVEKTQINKGFSNPVVAAPDGDYVYHIEKKGYNTTFGVTKIFLTQINRKGEKKTHELENVKDYGYRQMVFCSNKYLYFLSTLNGNETHDKKKVNEKIVLNTISHSDFTYNKVLLSLPVIEDPENTTFWTYIGHSNEEIYLASKSVKIKEGVYKYNVITVNPDGNIINNIPIDVSLNGEHIRPSFNVNLFSGNNQNRYNDFYSHYNSSSDTHTMLHHTGAFGNILINKKNNSIFIYGLYGSTPFKKIASKYEGHFVHKYDLEGNSVWKMQNNATGELASEKYFKIHASPYSRNLVLKLNPDNSLKFHIWFKKQIHTYEIADDGQMKGGYLTVFKKNIDMEEVNMRSSPSTNEKLEEYIKSISPKEKNNTSYNYSDSHNSGILIEYKYKEQKINLLFFDRSK